MMNKIIKSKEELYEKCENMEQFYDNYYVDLQQRIDKAIEYIRKNDALYEFKIDTSPEAIPNSVVVDDYKCRKELIEILGGK